MDYRILGPLEVLAPDGPVPLGGAKQRALLAILLLRANEVVSTDRLIDALWGEEPPETAPKALQVHVSQLRKALGPDAIRTRPPGYALDVTGSELDLDRFRRLREEAAGSPPARARDLLAEALALWRGPPLSDLTYAAFAQADIARLEELRLAAVEDRIAADLALGRHSELIAELEPLIAANPHRERLRAQLMLVLYRSGRQAEALEAFREARAVLTEELGIEPGRELRELHQSILEQDPSLDRPRPTPAAAPMRPSETFVGRERELAELAAALEDALQGHGRVVLVGGEPGIGKSRLADEVITAARARGARTLTGRCWEAGGAPAYWPWVQALRAYVAEADPAVVSKQVSAAGAPLVAVLPEARAFLPEDDLAREVDPDGARFRLMEAVTTFVRAAASRTPVVLFFDDLHAADAPSLLLMQFVAREIDEVPIAIVGCYRDTEVGAELGDALAELSREPIVSRIALKGLSAADTSRLLELVMGEGPAEELAAEVQAGTQGNPLFASEIARLLAAEGAAPMATGRLPIPEQVSEAIARRLQRQSSECRDALSAASVVGREFGTEVVARVSGLAHDALTAAFDEAAAARLVGSVPDASGRLRFSHILVRDALYDDLPVARRPELHRAVAEALEDLHAGNHEPHLAEIAFHYLEAGRAGADRALDYSEWAGDHAAVQHGYEEAARHYANALGVLDRGASAGSSRTCELLISLGEVRSRAGDLSGANEALRRAAALAEKEGLPRLLARAALQYGGRFTWGRASSDPALVPALRRALVAVDDDDIPNRVRLLGRLATALRDEASRDARVGLADEAIELAERHGDPATLAFAIGAHWIAVEGPDTAAQGLAAGQRLVELGEQVDDPERVFLGHDFRFNAFFKLCDRAGVDVELEHLTRLAGELRQPAHLWHVGTGRTMLALLEGRLEEAERLIAETLDVGRWAEGWTAAVSERLSLFVLRGLQGRLDEIVETMERSVHEFPVLLRFQSALAGTYAELGRERECRQVFAAVMARDLRREYVDAEWLLSMCLLGDPCAFLADLDAAERLYEILMPYDRLYAHAPVEVSVGSIARVVGVLGTTLGRLDEAEQHFDVALEIERRMRARPWLAHVQHDYGAMLLARGELERARELLDDAAATYRELGMESWAGRVDALTEPSRT